MKKHLLSIIASIVICALLLIGCGGGGGGGGSSAPSEPTEFIYSTEANKKGTFRLTSQKSGAIIESSEEGTLENGSSIVLTERLAKSNESKLYGGNSSNVYTLQAKNDGKTVQKLEKPIILTIPNNFGKEFKTFFLGSRSETASDWQYTQILDDNDTNPTVVKTARFAVKDLNTFKVKTYRLSYSFAIFASKDSSENKPTNTDSVKLMSFSADPTKVYYDKNNKFITDIKVSSCITANKSSALFDGSEVTSQLVFFNSNSADLSGLKIDGANAVQTSSTTKDSSNNQYSHTLYIKSYKKNNIAISGNNATYTFELKLTGVSTKDFPDSFRVKTVLKDANGTEFASEGSIKLKKEKEPDKVDTKTNTSTNTSTGTGTNTKTSTGTNTKTATGTNTNTKTSTSTKTSTGTSTNTNTNTNTNTKTNTSTDTGSNTTTQTTTSTGSETSTDTNTASSTDTGSNTSTTTSSDTNTSSNTQTTTNTDTNTGSGTSTETNTQTSTNTDTTSNTDTSTSTGTETLTTTEISVSISPTNSETTKVEVTTPIKITFDEKMDKTQNLLTLVTLICNSTTTNLITASNQLEWSTENNKDVLTVKNTKLNPEQSYTIKLNSGLKTETGLTSTNQINSNFVTRDAVALSVTNLTTQNAPLNTIIEITPTGGSISSIESASISFNSNSKTGSFSIQNGKAYFTLTSGTTWDPETTYSGTINGILDSDGCETKSCSFSFTTRNQTTLAFQTQESYHARSSLAFTVANGSITDLSTANISYSGGSINCSLSSNNGNIICSLGENAQWAFNSYLSVTISNLKDSEGAPVANSTANFNIGAQPFLSCENYYIKANGDLVFTVVESTITSLTNANVTFTGANVSGNLQLENGKVVYKLTNNSLYPFASNATINISGLKDANGVTVANLSQNFITTSQTEIDSFTKSDNLRDNISLSYSGGFTGWNVSYATAVFDNANVNGTFSIENGKIIYKLNTGCNYPPSTRVTGKISGIKDADGLPVKEINISFETRQPVVLYTDYCEESYNNDNVFNLNKIEFVSYSHYLQDAVGYLTNARVVLDNGTTVNGSFSINSVNQTLVFTPNNPFTVNTTLSGKLTGVKDFEDVTIADCAFKFKTRDNSIIQLIEPTSPNNRVYLNDSIKFNISNLVYNNENSNEASNGNTSNISISFDNCSVAGNISLEENGFVIVFTPSSNQLWPANTTVTGKISGITQNDGGIIPEYSFSFQTQYLKGKGTKTNPWLVSNADDLNNVRYISKQNSYQYVEQTEDIDLSAYGTSYDNGKGWLPITSLDNEYWFYGHYNGNNHKITNLYINRPNETVGIFMNINGDIKNLGVELSSNGIQGLNGAALALGFSPHTELDEVKNCWVGGTGKITCSSDCGGLFGSLEISTDNCYSTIDVEGSGKVGGLCSYGCGISNSYSTGTVKNNSSSGFTGGLIAEGGDLSNCYSQSLVNGGKIVGGLIGYGGNIENCYATGNVTGSNVNNSNVGGLVGYGGYIENCYATGNVTCSNSNNSSAGGLVGYCSDGNIENCYATGNIIGASSNNNSSCGGLIGEIYNPSSNNNISNCFATGNISGTGTLGGFIGISSNCNLNIINCYASSQLSLVDNGYAGGFVGVISNSINNITNCYTKGNITIDNKGFSGGFIGNIAFNDSNCSLGNCCVLASEINAADEGGGYAEEYTNRIIGQIDFDPTITISNCYANKNMTLKVNGVSIQPGLQNPLPETVALDGADGANLPDNPDWKNEIFKDGYEEGTSFDDIWEIGTSGLPILKNMPGNPAQ